MSNFQNTAYRPVDHQKRDDLIELTSQLTKAINFLIRDKLTSRQSEVVQKIYFEEKTQMETADSLGICQTTVHKTLKGNIDYSNNRKRYGGALKKLKRLCAADPEIVEIMEKIAELRSDLAD